MTTGGVGQGSSGRAAFDHRQNIFARHPIRSELVSLPDRAEERSLSVVRDLCRQYPGIQ
jgi:hypothetical protein